MKKNIKTIIIWVSIGVITYIITTYLNLEKKNPTENNTANNNGINNGVVAGKIEITNQKAIYIWKNKNNWIPNYHNGIYGKENFKTDLIFEANTSIYPGKVCFEMETDRPIISAVPIISSFTKANEDGTQICFDANSQIIKIELITQGTPTQIEARLINQ